MANVNNCKFVSVGESYWNSLPVFVSANVHGLREQLPSQYNSPCLSLSQQMYMAYVNNCKFVSVSEIPLSLSQQMCMAYVNNCKCVSVSESNWNSVPVFVSASVHGLCEQLQVCLCH